MKTWVKIILGLVAVGIVSALLVYKYVYNKKHPDYERIEAAYTINAHDLFYAFKNSKEAATRQYNGQVLEITGKLSKVEAADTLVTAVFAFEQGMFGDEGIRCTMLKKYNDAAMKLQPDGEVRFKGYCTGYNDTDVIIEKCSIITQ
jgi:hypothetical protein